MLDITSPQTGLGLAPALRAQAPGVKTTPSHTVPLLKAGRWAHWPAYRYPHTCPLFNGRHTGRHQVWGSMFRLSCALVCVL
eukprot:6745475-Prymnesium_polylepis.1